MIRLIVGLVCLTPAPGLAGQLPISAGASYCNDAMTISADRYWEEGVDCVAKDTAKLSERIVLLCTPDPDITDRTEPWTWTVTLTEDVAVGTLTFQVEGDEPIVLKRCE